jgi:hypothetical protein
MTVKTSKYEDMCLVRDVDSHIIIFSCTSNLRVLCTQVKEIFIDGIFKCCPKFFEQLHSIHGYSNGHYIPRVFALLVSKSEYTYRKFFQYVIRFEVQEKIMIWESTSFTKHISSDLDVLAVIVLSAS